MQQDRKTTALASGAAPAWRAWLAHTNPIVFLCASGAVLLIGALLIVRPGASQAWLEAAQLLVAAHFGWYYMLAMAVSVGFALWLALSRHGALRLGDDDESPEFNYLSWVSMLFSSGIGIALVYYGVYEPLDHFLMPPTGAGGTQEAARNALTLTFLHWGIHGWTLYALTATALAYFAYRHKEPLALRSPLQGISGKPLPKGLGHAVDGFGVLATIVSMVTNLGLGALLLHAGLTYLWGVPNTAAVQMPIVIIMMVVATGAAALGIKRGIAILSNVNTALMCLLLLFVFLAGPTRLLLDGLVQNLGDYLNAFLGKSFDLYLYDRKAVRWTSAWTIFYWAWWIGWAPFVGMFIARISRGRRIRELIFGVMLVPLGFTLAWLSIFGNTAINLVLNDGAASLGRMAMADPPMAFYSLMEYLPMTQLVAGVGVVMSFMVFLTPVDSGTLMIANLSARNADAGQDAPIWLRIFWAVLTTMLGVGLLLAGNFNAMQTAVVLCGLPFSVILLCYMVSLYKALARDNPEPSSLPATR